MKILIADDHEMIRQGLRRVLQRLEGACVCGEATNGREAVSLALRLKPDVAILDLTMPDLNGVEAARKIHEALPTTRLVILTMHQSKGLAQAALAAGACGFVLKTEASTSLLDQLRRLEPGKGKQELTSRSLTPLTRREIEVIKLIAQNRTSKQVAADLGISVYTVQTHRANLMRKLELRSISELVHYAIGQGLIPG